MDEALLKNERESKTAHVDGTPSVKCRTARGTPEALAFAMSIQKRINEHIFGEINI